jgi:Alternative complex III, ActD subunit
MEILGLFRTVDEAVRAVEKLLDTGIAEERITSLSGVPFHDGVLVNSGYRRKFHLWTLAGGVLGALAGFFLAAGTAWLYPVQTGDKPIIAFFPVGIVTYEMMMLLAIVGTLLGMLWEMGLPDIERHAYDPELANGLIGILVTAESEAERGRAGELLTAAGALRLRTDDGDFA